MDDMTEERWAKLNKNMVHLKKCSLRLPVSKALLHIVVELFDYAKALREKNERLLTEF